jgi:hypothetical protein
VPIRRAALLALLMVQSGSIFAQSHAASAPVAQTPAKVLYIGNSYTYYHRMPGTVFAMARTDGSPRELHAQVVAVPSATLQRHWDSGAAQSAIQERKWDYVILQEQSVLPLEQKERMYEHVRLLDKVIKLNGARTVLFLTWARRDRPETQAALNAAYGAIAKELGALIAPVGPAWQIARQRAPDLQLYEEDGSHPTPEGSYLTACVLYLTLQPAERQCPAPQNGATEIQAVDILRTAAASALADHGR